MRKGDFYIYTDGGIYMAVGWWGKEIVLADADPERDEVLIYGEREFAGLISEGRFRKLYRTEAVKMQRAKGGATK